MDSRDASIHSRQGITMTPPPYAYHHLHTNSNNQPPSSNFIPTNPSYAFNSLSAPFDPALLPHQQHNQQQQNGSHSTAGPDADQPGRRKRGRPRKCSPDATGLVLSSNSHGASVAEAGASGSVKKEIGSGVNGEGTQGRRQRGRPPGSGKKQLDALGGVAGSGFTPHVIKVFPKEDVVSKVNEFCQEGPRTITILSAYGAVCNATIQRPGSTDESGTIFCEGYNDILNLAGPFFYVNCDERRGNDFDLIILLMGSDGKSVGGRVVGNLIAATTIQIIAGSYIEDQKKSNGGVASVSSPLPSQVPHMLAFGGHSTTNGTALMKAASDSSEDNGATGSHSQSHSHRPYNNDYPMQSLPMFQQHMGWANTGLGDVHNHNNNE